jgi:hypothetical protein
LRNGNADRRERLAEVFEHFSQNCFLAPWTVILPVEIHHAIIQTFAPGQTAPVPQIFGGGFTFGLDSRILRELKLSQSAEYIDKLNLLATQPGVLSELLTFSNEPNRVRQKELIAELNDRDALAAEELRMVRKPYAKIQHRRAQYVRYTHMFQGQLRNTLRSVGRTLDDFIALGVDGLTEFWSRVPSLDVDCELTLYRDRQWSRSVQSNDFCDIGHLVLAVPYCDIVVVEKFWARALEETGLAQKYHVVVCSDLAQLPAHLEQLRTVHSLPVGIDPGKFGSKELAEE